MRLGLLAPLALPLILGGGLVHAQATPAQQPRTRPTDSTRQAVATPPRPAPPPEEKSSVTHHTARIGGQQIAYTATAATYIVKADHGPPKAVFFFLAHTRGRTEPGLRPGRCPRPSPPPGPARRRAAARSPSSTPAAPAPPRATPTWGWARGGR